MIAESITGGFVLANRNLKLVFIHIVVSVLNIAGMLVFLLLPLIVVAAYLGFDLEQAREALPVLMHSPLEFLSRYFVIAILSGISLIVYLTLSSLLIMYALGGTLGILRRSEVDRGFSFRLSDFFREAGAHFVRLIWTASLVLLGALLLIIACMITWGVASAVLHSIAAPGSKVELFFSTFGTLSAFTIIAVISVSGFIFTLYSMVIAVSERKGAGEALPMTFRLLTGSIRPLILFLILFAAAVAVNAVWYGIQLSLALSPFLLPLTWIAGAFLQGYLSIVVWGSLISYYMKHVNQRAGLDSYEI